MNINLENNQWREVFASLLRREENRNTFISLFSQVYDSTWANSEYVWNAERNLYIRTHPE